MNKTLKLEITVSANTEEAVDLELIREFKDLMGKIKRGESSGNCFMTMEYGDCVTAYGSFIITPKGLNL